MSAKCVAEILDKAKKLGVEITEREAGEMFRRIRAKERYIKRELDDPQGDLFGKPQKEPRLAGESLREKIKTLSPEDRLREYGRMAFEDFVGEKKEALRRRYLQIERSAALDEKVRLTDQPTHIKAVNEIAFKTDARKNAIVSLDMAELGPAIDKYLGWLGGKITHEDALNVTREIARPGSTKDANAKTLAEVWTKTREVMRERKNALGADIGRLEDWIMPQAWDARGIRKAGKEAWIEDVFPLLNRKKYWDEATGEYLNDAQMREVLAYTWDTITTGGLNEPVIAGAQSSLAKKLGKHREIHFNDPDAWYAMAVKYGQRDIFQLMGRTVIKDAKDVAMLETYGPNPNAGFDTALALAKSLDRSDKGAWMAKNYFEELKGSNTIPE